MKAGKISETIYRRSVIKKCTTKREDVQSAMAVGIDGALLKVERSECLAFTSASLAGVKEKIGWAVGNRFLNRMAAVRAKPMTAWLSFAIPCTFTERDIRQVMEEIDAICVQSNMQICGCQIEASENIFTPVLTLTGVGITEEKSVLNAQKTSKKKYGEDIVMCGHAGAETAVLLAFEREEKLLKRYSRYFIKKIQELTKSISIVSEAAVASRHGATAMHVIEEGGVFGALWELCEAAGIGMEADIKKIPIQQETIEVCEIFDMNPYEVPAGGLLIRTLDGRELVEKLKREGLYGAIIGRTTQGNNRLLWNEEEKRFLEHPVMDEVLKGFRMVEKNI